jgi:hypothetical protein
MDERWKEEWIDRGMGDRGRGETQIGENLDNG